jgi:hypothetical protein
MEMAKFGFLGSSSKQAINIMKIVLLEEETENLLWDIENNAPKPIKKSALPI